jgi:hypothetical protein
VIDVTRRLLAFGLAAAAGLACAQSPSDAPEPDAATVLRSEGTTMLVRGASYSTPVRTDVPIRSGDRIRTGADGRVQLRFSDGALISLQPDSDFRVESYAFEAARQRGWFELVQGSMRAVSGRIGKRDREDWRLRTPTATIGIRGTVFSVEHAGCTDACPAGVEPGLFVAVHAGRVAVSNAAGSVEVPAGRSLRVRDSSTEPALAAVTGAGAAGRDPRSAVSGTDERARRANAPGRAGAGADGGAAPLPEYEPTVSTAVGRR